MKLVPVTRENVIDICRIQMAPYQFEYCAHPAAALAQAQFTDPKPDCYGVKDGDAWIGFLQLIPRGSHVEGVTSLHIWRVVVDVRYQCRRYGAKILQMAKDIAQADTKYGFVTTDLHLGPFATTVFWEKQGFKVTGRLMWSGQTEVAYEVIR